MGRRTVAQFANQIKRVLSPLYSMIPDGESVSVIESAW